MLAALCLLRAGLRYSLEGAEGRSAVLEDLTRAVTLNYYVVVPLEFRSEELSAFLTEARRMSGRKAPSRIEHKLPEVACEQDIQFEALLGVPDGGTAVLYWKRATAETFQEVEMEVFSNVAETTIWQQEYFENFSLWAFMDAPSEVNYTFGSCDPSDGSQENEYANNFTSGRPYTDVLNQPAKYIERGDWVAEGLVWKNPEDVPELYLDYEVQ